MQEVNPNIPPFNKQLWLNEELQVKWIYWLFKVIKKTVSGTGDADVICWFSPKLIMVSVQNSTENSDWWSDFEKTFSIRKFNNAWVYWTSESTNLINLSWIVATIQKRLYNGFTINVSSISGSQNIYFTCFS